MAELPCLPHCPSYSQVSPPVQARLGLNILAGFLSRALSGFRDALGIEILRHHGMDLIGQRPADMMRIIGADVLLLALA